MKILFTSDLHLHQLTKNKVMGIVAGKVKSEKPDVLVISGDVTDMSGVNVFRTLGALDVPVVFCLGNHEFAYRSVGNTIESMMLDASNAAVEGISHVHCLDIEDSVDIGGVRFYGNVLWYDGSLSNRMDTSKYMDHVWDNWLDASIQGFVPIREHNACVDSIIAVERMTENMPKVLVTHMVPHRKLNKFDVITPMSIANCYSGVDDLFDRHLVYPDYALCGHTHQRVLYEHRCANGHVVKCINSGNDYFWNSNTVIFDTLEM